jgi:hypothetical protein
MTSPAHPPHIPHLTSLLPLTHLTIRSPFLASIPLFHPALNHSHTSFTHPTLQRRSELFIPSQFLHLCICEQFIYSLHRSTCFAAKEVDPLWEYINRSQMHECRNWERGLVVSYVGIYVSIFGVFSVYPYERRFPYITFPSPLPHVPTLPFPTASHPHPPSYLPNT